jgi:flavin-dependent dehydrogenase
VLVAGDAGGFVNGFTAEGIYYAMVSGELAARALLDRPSAGPSDVLGRYAAACESEMGQELRESVLIQRTLFADRRKIARIIHGVAHEPVLTRAILAFAAGRLRYADLRRRLIARAPLFAIRLAWERFRPFCRPPGVLTGASGEASGAT